MLRSGRGYSSAERSARPLEALAIPDPAKPGVIVGHAASASQEDVADAVAAAKAAFPAWAALTPQERAAKMAEAIAGIADDRDEDAAILSQENGKVRFEGWVDALVFEIRWQLALMLADEVDTGKTLPVAPGIPVSTEVTYQPLGVVTVIVPFNWPIAILGASLPHALLAGNTAIVKPPPSAPLATTRVMQRVAEKLPPGVLNVVTGKDENMTGLIQNTDIAKVCFTGSVNGGKRIMELASKTLTRVTLELGGNDAAVFLEDAILDDTHLDRLYAAIYDTTGQICMNAKRVFVHRSRLDEVVAGLTERLEKAKLGYGLDEGTTMGPLHSPVQKAFVDEIIQEAKDAGADVREFGEMPGGELEGGNWVRPAIVVDPDPGLRVVTAGAVRARHPRDPVRHRAGGPAPRERHVGRPLRIGVDGRPGLGQARRIAARLRLRVGQRPRRHPPRPARALRRHEAVGHRPRAGHRGRPRVPGHPRNRDDRPGGPRRDGALSQPVSSVDELSASSSTSSRPRRAQAISVRASSTRPS